MRVLHVNVSALRAGGVEVFLHDLMAWQRAHGLTVALFAETHAEGREEDELCLVQRPEWEPARLMRDRPCEEALARFVRRFRPDLVHVHNVHRFPPGLIVVLAGLGVPLVHHVHDAAPLCGNTWLTWPDGTICPGGVGQKCFEHGCEQNAPFEARTLAATAARTEALRRSADHWIACSRAMVELCERHGLAPCAWIPYWQPPVAGPAPATAERSEVVLSVGRLVKEKGVDVLLRAWPAIRAARPAARLLVAGEGPERARLETLARMQGLDPAACFLGRVTHEEVDGLMRRAQVLVVPSIWFEAFGLTVIEAQRAGLPAVVSGIGGLCELVEPEVSGLHFPPRDERALAQAVARLLSEPELHRRCVEGGFAAAAARRDDAPMHAILAVYSAAQARGTAHRRPVDMDSLDLQDRMLQERSSTEQWALGMQKHLQHLESQNVSKPARRPLRILHINMFAERVGGAEVYMNDLVDAERWAGHTVGIFAAHSSQSAATPILRVVTRPDWDGAGLVGDPPFEQAFLEFAREFRADILHVHNLNHFPARLVARIAELGVPTVQTIHDAGLFCANAWLILGDGRPCAGGVGEKCLVNGCEKNYPFDARTMLGTQLRLDAVRRTFEAWIAPSRFYARTAEAHGLAPVVRLPYAAKAPEPGVVARPSTPRVLFAGRLVPEKGVEFLLRAWPEVLRAHPAAELRIAGDGPERERLGKLAGELGLEVASIFIGRLPHPEVRRHMLEARLLAIPSIWAENSPLSCYEALQIGLPMVASNVGGLGDLVIDGQTGRLVPPRDPAALATAIVQALGAPDEWQRWQKNGLELVREFAPERHLEEMLTLYERAIARGVGHRQPIDLDLVKSAELMSRKLAEVEQWGLGMQKHIRHLETLPRAIQPVHGLARRVKDWLRAQRG